MSRGQQIIRQWRILQRLESNGSGLSAAELAGEENCSRRTIYRDLTALQEVGFPLYHPDGDGKNGRWALLHSHGQKTPLPIPLGEAMALYISRNVLKGAEHTFLYKDLDAFFTKIKTLLPPDFIQFINEVENNLYVKSRPHKQPGPDLPERLTTLHTAITENRSLDITYHTMSRDQETRRRIDPYGVECYDGSFYLIAHCQQKNALRIFSLDRIKTCHLTDALFNRPKGFSTRRHMTHSFGIFQGPPTPVKIRFSPEVAGYIKEKKWHDSQILTRNPDGSLDFQATVAGTREIRFWILSWGASARVLAPDSLKQDIQAEIRAMQADYNNQN
ncbi:MAG: transcriptional regulator [Thermodesulfobacteriota bacterium]|nr:transcriptional regulator [Thermodesulfobacteriota bacterium]